MLRSRALAYEQALTTFVNSEPVCECARQGEGSARASVGQEKKLLDRRFLTKPRHALNVNDISK